MKNTLLFAIIFISGLLLGTLLDVDQLLPLEWMKTAVINLLLLLIGVGVGADVASFTKLRQINKTMLMMPFLVAAGSVIGTGLIALLFPLIGFKNGLAVGAGFGFYSLSSVILTDLQGVELGTIALLTNLIRELATILSAPILARWIGWMAPIASAGATSMDISLPVIQRYSGNQYTMVSIFNGVVLSVLVPILVPIFGG